MEEELRVALAELNAGKSPGSDGIPPEFYSKFWQHLSPFFGHSLAHAIHMGSLSTNQCRGVITLIPKKDVDRRRIENWRPITLLNCDYKIFTKAVAIRLQRVMGKLIHHNQTGFMAGR